MENFDKLKLHISMHINKLGILGEDIACNYLIDNDYEILFRNIYVNKISEIDILARKDNSLRFVEIKTRSNERYLNIEQSITISKQKKIVNASHTWLIANDYNLLDTDYGFDFIGIILNKNKTISKIEFIQDFIK